MEKNISSEYRYLEKLKFRSELRKSWLNFFVVNFRVVILLIILLTSLGFFSYWQLPIESEPEVKIPIAVIYTAFPGASPADVEELVTKKIETEIASLKDINKITSNSYNSISSVTVEFNAKADLDDSLRKLRDSVNNLRNNLPSDADEPSVLEISLDDRPIFSFSLAGPYDGLTLRQYAQEIQDELEKIAGVREVRVSGGTETEIEIAYNSEKLSKLNLSPLAINQILASANILVPAGNFSGEKYNYSIRIDGRFFSAKTLGEIPIFQGEKGNLLYLKDIATVREKAIKKTVYSRFSQKGNSPEDSVSVEIIKKTGGSIVKTADLTKKKIEEMMKNAPTGMYYDITIDTAKGIQKNFDQLLHDFFLTILLVFGILFLIVGLKEALVASLAIPLVFFVTFGVMLWIGVSLNFLSMISLILALGLLVDDAIVVVSATKQYLKTGKFTPEEAVLLVLNDFKVVLTTTTLTTVWAFLPLLFSSGIIGEYIRSIPVTVSVTLIASLFIALIINHPLAAILERIRLTKTSFFLVLVSIFIFGGISFQSESLFWKGSGVSLAVVLVFWLIYWYFRNGKQTLKENQLLMQREWKSDELIKEKLKLQGNYKENNWLGRLIHGVICFDRAIPLYEKYLRQLLATRKRRIWAIVLTIGLFLLAVSLPVTGIVKSEFFPVTDMELVFVNIEAPVGLKLEETNKIVTLVEDKLLKYPEIVNFSTVVGQGGSMGRFGSGGSSSSHLGEITIKLQEKEDRQIKSYEWVEILRKDLAEIQEAVITVESLRGGPPSGAAFEARILGEDLDVLEKIANDLKPILKNISGIVNPEISLKNSPADYTFILDHQKLKIYNLDVLSVTSFLRMAISGLETTKILQEGEEIKVIARLEEGDLPDLASIENLSIKNNQGQNIFLKEVAEIRLEPSVENILRVDQKRAVILSAGVTGKTSPVEVVKEFQKKVSSEYAIPEGYELVYGGENEQNVESVQSIIQAMIIALVLIIATLVIQFNSFKKTIIVLVTIPLALVGVFFGLAIFGISLSFPGLIGVVALFGIVVKNAIILVDKINLNLKVNIPFQEAIVDAGKSRLEAIFITSISTIVGITPVTLSNETWLAMGSAIIFGLLLSSFLTLFIVPVLFLTFIKGEE